MYVTHKVSNVIGVCLLDCTVQVNKEKRQKVLQRDEARSEWGRTCSRDAHTERQTRYKTASRCLSVSGDPLQPWSSQTRWDMQNRTSMRLDFIKGRRTDEDVSSSVCGRCWNCLLVEYLRSFWFFSWTDKDIWTMQWWAISSFEIWDFKKNIHIK